MKKIFLCFAIIGLALQSCKKDNDDDTNYQEPSIETQNDYDDQAAQKYLNDHYFDVKGNVKQFSSTDTSDDNFPKLSSYNPVKLPSGVIYIVRPGAQPEPGTTIAPTDSMRIMSNTTAAVATLENDIIMFRSSFMMNNDVTGSGLPHVDPKYYYVTEKFMADNKNTDRNFYQMEGFREAIQHFKAFDKQDEEDYNLQGVIIVPSRAAFARDNHYAHTIYSFRNRSFIFNFQVYKTSTRLTP